MRQNLEDYLSESGRFNADQLGDARRTQRFFGGSLLSNMVRLGYVNEREAGELLSDWSTYPYLPFRELKKRPIAAEILDNIEPDVAARRKVVPYALEDGRLLVVTCSNENDIFFQELGRRLNATVQPYIMPDERVEQLLERHYGVASARKEAVPVDIHDTAADGETAAPVRGPRFEPEDAHGVPEDIGLDGLPLDADTSAASLDDGGDAHDVSLSSLVRRAGSDPSPARIRGGGQAAGSSPRPDASGDDSSAHSAGDLHGYSRPGGTVERPFALPSPGPDSAGGDEPPAARSGPFRMPPASGPGTAGDARGSTGSTMDGPDMQARSNRDHDPFDTAETRLPVRLESLESAERPDRAPEAGDALDRLHLGLPVGEAQPPAHARVTGKGPLSIDNPLQILSRALDRGRIGKAAVELVLSMGATRAALFSHQQERLVGWEAGGKGVQDRLFARLSLPLYAPSIFSSMRVKATPYVGIVPDQPANREFLQTLGGEAPAVAAAVPVTLKGRLVAVLYADGGPGAQQVIELARLQDAASKLGLALEILLLRRKILA